MLRYAASTTRQRVPSDPPPALPLSLAADGAAPPLLSLLPEPLQEAEASVSRWWRATGKHTQLAVAVAVLLFGSVSLYALGHVRGWGVDSALLDGSYREVSPPAPLPPPALLSPPAVVDAAPDELGSVDGAGPAEAGPAGADADRGLASDHATTTTLPTRRLLRQSFRLRP